MIDLDKDQIIDPPIKCWVRNADTDSWIMENLFAIDHRLTEYGFRTAKRSWRYCMLTDPNKPKIKKWERVEDIPPELWGKALVKRKDGPIHRAVILEPYQIVHGDGEVYSNIHYLPLGQPLTGKWLPFESEVTE